MYRWVQHYAPELKKRLEWHKKRYSSRWHLDETYIKVKGESYATIKGFEIMRMFKKGQFNIWMYGNLN